ncbi:hypothetical protein [Herbaspirillum sp. CAH-3]|uniref:hypothetical protein n=1 Tax=Herbaspirillum sp. CAH-3 TaxID=2605746 RepID=UPI001E3EB813|nr:hypothetical protein [Herbaspirillum sp. CAH-3]
MAIPDTVDSTEAIAPHGPALPDLMPAALQQLLESRLPRVIRREPGQDDATRWRRWEIGGRTVQIAQPVTFTPYASARPCSARCRFCSETLDDGGPHAAALRPGPQYGAQLRQALAALRGLPLSWSLSGLETTDDAGWMLSMLDALQEHARQSPVQGSVLYTNGAGLASPQGAELITRLQAFDLGWVELSRHHHEAGANQAIMRFRSGQTVATQIGIDATLTQLVPQLPVKLVCIVQQGGIDGVLALKAYLRWARQHGVKAVILREFSQLGPQYRNNVTARYIGGARIDVAALLAACLADPEWSAEAQLAHATSGYYFWNVVLHWRGMQLTFEASDYVRMHARHASGRIYKLVFHANGRLCGGWNAEQHVLLETAGAAPMRSRAVQPLRPLLRSPS